MPSPFPLGASDSARLASLYRRFGPLVYAHCNRMLRDAASAEDTVQDVFLRAAPHLGALRQDDAAIAGWLRQIARNLCLNRLRDRQRHATPMAPESLPEATEAQAPEGDPAEWTRACIDHAPVHVRDAATLHYVEGVPQADVARRLGQSRRTVCYRLQEFLASCRALQASGALAT